MFARLISDTVSSFADLPTCDDFRKPEEADAERRGTMQLIDVEMEMVQGRKGGGMGKLSNIIKAYVPPRIHCKAIISLISYFFDPLCLER